MSGAGAFYGDADLKARACVDAGGCVHRGWHLHGEDTDRIACAEAFGLTVDFLNLMVRAAYPPFQDGSCAFLERTLQALPTGADVPRTLRGWMLRIWNHQTLGVSRKLADTQAFEPATSIIDAIRREMSAPGTSPAWRPGRAALLSTFHTLPPAVVGYARVVAAMAWDPETTPDLARDVWEAWEKAAIGEIDLAHGWDEPTQDALNEIVRAAMQKVFAVHAFPEPGPEAAAAFETATRPMLNALLEEAGVVKQEAALRRHWEENLQPFVPVWRADALRTITEACAHAA